MNYRKLFVFPIVLLILLGGCTFQSSPTPSIPETSTGSGGGHDTSTGEISLTTQKLVTDNGTFEYEARISLDFYIEERTFSNVTLCLYDAEGAVLNSTVIGDLSPPVDHETVRISANTTPKYVVADHIGFHQYRKMQVMFLVHKSGDFTSGFSYDAISFDYPRPNRSRTCL